MCTLACTSPCTFYKDRNIEGKLKVYSTHHLDFALHSRTNLGIKTIFYIERNNKQVSYLNRTKQPDNFPSTLFDSNENGQPSVCWFKTARLLSEHCRHEGFGQITQTSSNTRIMVEIFTIFQNYSAFLLYIETFSYNNMVDCCVSNWLTVAVKVSA